MNAIKLKREYILPSILFLMPTLILVTLIIVVPIGLAFNTSLRHKTYANVGKFIGLTHYKTILGSKDGWSAIGNSITYVVFSLLVVVPTGIIVGVLLNRKIRARVLFRTILVIPWVLSQTVTALLWKWVLNSNFGPIVLWWQQLTGSLMDFFNSELASRGTVISANAWNTYPIIVIITLAALQVIPEELYEAAKVDGASRTSIFWRITLPLLIPSVSTIIIMQSIEYFNMVTLIYVLTAGGPFGATTTLSVRAFKTGFDFWHIGLGSAYSFVIFIVNIFFSIIYVRAIRGKEDEK